MAQNTSYPSPNSAQIGEGPFYASQHQLPVAAEEVPTPTPQPRRAPPTTGTRDGETDERAQAVRNTQELRQIQIASPQQLAQSGLDSAQSYDHNAAEAASRKRTKVSRACDECRRKKIRCDAPSEAPGAQCSSCKRSDMLCMFSRTPQKRGPSKGYIKELAERVGALEGRRPMPPISGYQYGAYNEYSPQPEEQGYGPRKRTHSLSEGLQGSSYTPDNTQASIVRESTGRFPPAATSDWSGRDTTRQMSQASPSYAAINNTDQPSALINQETPTLFARRGSNQAAMDVANVLGGRQNEQGDVAFEWDEYAIDEYYRVIHPTHPLLPDSKAELHLHLAKASGPMRDAFLATFQPLVKPVSTASASDPQNARFNSKAAELLMAMQFEDAASRSFVDNLVYVQALLLMVLITDMNVSASSQPPVWYSLAFSMATFLSLRTRQPYKNNTNLEITELEKPARRAWLLLMTLDRWHAASTLNPLLFPEKGVTLLQQDQSLLGEVGFHFARLSLTLGHISDALVYHSERTFVDRSSAAMLFRVLDGELERVRESVENLFASVPFLHVSFLHIKLLLNRHALAHHFESDGVAGIALEVVALLCNDHCPVSPLTHHFASLAAAALVENAPTSEANDIFVRGLQDLRYWLEKDSNPMSSAAESGRASWKTSIAQYIAVNLPRIQQRLPSNGTPIDRGGLQHLADAAVGKAETMGGEKATEDGAKGSDGGNVDFTVPMARGYLHLVK